MSQHDVIIVGAGAAGVGMAATLKDFGIDDCVLLDRHEIGASFARWPAEMRLITPSFNSTPFGILDLNAVTLNTSIANLLGEEHPTGKQYSFYLQAVAEAMRIPTRTEWEVTDVEERASGGFRLTGPKGTLDCTFLVWAAGEFQFPRANHFEGAEHGVHNSLIPSYHDLDGEEFVVIGAFESGVDAAVHLAESGKKVSLLCSQPQLALTDQDPSLSLSPFTRQRLRLALIRGGHLEIHYDCQVAEIQTYQGGFAVYAKNGQAFYSPTPPILATGFRGGTGPVEHLFDYRADGEMLLTENDESTYTRDLFLAGPLVRHDHHIFCYIYKFRQRFAVIAETIADRLGVPVSEDLLETYERNQMRLIDLSCCDSVCLC